MQKNESPEGALDFYACMYDHYTKMLMRADSCPEVRAFRLQARERYMESFLELVPVDSIAEAAGLIKIGDGYAKA